MYVCTCVCRVDVSVYDCICIYGQAYGQASGVPSPPPPPKGMVWKGPGVVGGPSVCGEGLGPLELQLEGRPGVTDEASIVRKPYASHEPYNT